MTPHGYFVAFVLGLGLCLATYEPQGVSRARCFLAGFGWAIVGIVAGLIVSWMKI